MPGKTDISFIMSYLENTSCRVVLQALVWQVVEMAWGLAHSFPIQVPQEVVWEAQSGSSRMLDYF